MAVSMVKHTCGGPSFGRLTAGCPRCEELQGGAEPRAWNIRKPEPAHRCTDKCKPMCTWGW